MIVHVVPRVITQLPEIVDTTDGTVPGLVGVFLVFASREAAERVLGEDVTSLELEHEDMPRSPGAPVSGNVIDMAAWLESRRT